VKKFRPDVDANESAGRYYPYDIVKEGVIALVVVVALVLGLSVLFGSPDEHQRTLRDWALADPADFAGTAFTEMNYTSGTGSYGPPYNTNGTGQQIGPLKLQQWAGVRIPVNTQRDFVIYPLSTLPNDPALTSALSEWEHAGTTQQDAWMASFANGTVSWNGTTVAVSPSQPGSGPVLLFLQDLTSMARSGALDSDLISQNGFYSTDYTKPLLFIADGNWFSSLADAQHLSGDQWGMMNETGSYPGQAWLWLYTFWYQIEPFKSSDNADALVWGLMMVLSAGLVFLPFIPGLRSIPRWSRVYRIIWREHYRDQRRT
jgi:hypothetical protein